MNITLIALRKKSSQWAAVFTRNAFPGAPVKVGRRMLEDKADLGAIVINNKISNVCPGSDGVRDSEIICKAVGALLKHSPDTAVLPCSTGVIGWSLPVSDMVSALPGAIADLQTKTALPAAEAIMTTDLYPKVRSSSRIGSSQARIVGFAKGAGMVEPDMATMLAFLLTDLAVPREDLQAMLHRASDCSFNCISVDSDQSTSDSVVVVSSGEVEPVAGDLEAFEEQLHEVCAALSADIVRNGEGVRHVLRVRVTGAPTSAIARGVGKAVVNSPLTKCAVAGNDPNVGRIIGAVGSYLGTTSCAGADMDSCEVDIGGETVFQSGAFALSTTREEELVRYFEGAQLYRSQPTLDAVTAAALRSASSPLHPLPSLPGEKPTAIPAAHVYYAPPLQYPPHDRYVDIAIRLGLGGDGAACILGADLTHEYVAENADYRS